MLLAASGESCPDPAKAAPVAAAMIMTKPTANENFTAILLSTGRLIPLDRGLRPSRRSL
jgi:hypothetical protein